MARSQAWERAAERWDSECWAWKARTSWWLSTSSREDSYSTTKTRWGVWELEYDEHDEHPDWDDTTECGECSPPPPRSSSIHPATTCETSGGLSSSTMYMSMSL